MRRFIGGIWRWFKRLVLLLLFLIIGFYIALFFPAVQKFVGTQFANLMSMAWDTKVTIGGLTMKPLTNFEFHDFYIEDHHGDTLIFAKYVEAGGYNIFSLLDKKIDIGTATIHDVVFKVQRLPKEKEFNINFVIKFFEGSDDGAVREKFKFSMGKARLKNARFHFYDAAVGTSVLAISETGYIDAHDVDMIGKKAWGDTACLENSSLFVHVFEPTPIPGVDSSWWEVPVDSTIPYWDVWCNTVYIKDLHYRLLNERIGVDESRDLDFSDLDFEDIDLKVDSFRLEREHFTGWVRELHGKDHRGFEVKSLTGHGSVSPDHVAATQFKLVTNNSVLGDSLVFRYKQYRDFFEFVDKVKIYSTLDNCRFTFGDLATFAPKIADNEFIDANLDKEIKVSGQYHGKINNFRAKNLDIKVGKNSHIYGDVRMKDVTTPDGTHMHLTLEKVQTDYGDLKSLLPFVKLPHQLANLGTMTFQGSYFGFFQDFVANGILNTQIGRIDSDLKLNIKGGSKLATYSGGLQFNKFELGQFLGNEDLGQVTLKTKIKGKGLTLASLNAELQDAKIDSFDFKKYRYKNVIVNGKFQQKKFEGDVLSKDRNVDFKLDGKVDFNEELPIVNISGHINQINFDETHLTNENIGLSIEHVFIKTVGDNIDNFQGKMSLTGIKGHRGNIHSELDRIDINAEDKPIRLSPIDRGTMGDSISLGMGTLRKIELQSDNIKATIEGNFKMYHLARSIEDFLRRNQPNLFKDLNYMQDSSRLVLQDTTMPLEDYIDTIITTTPLFIPDQNVEMDITITDSKNLSQLINPSFKKLKDIYLHAEYDSFKENLTLGGDVGKVEIDNIAFNNLNFSSLAYKNKFDIRGNLQSMTIKDSTFLPNTDIRINAISDSVVFDIKTNAIGNVASNIAVRGKLEIEENQAIVRLDTSNLQVLNLNWTINDDNYIKIGNNTLDIYNVRLTNDDKLIAVSSLGSKGLRARLENISLGWLYKLGKPLPKIDIDGKFSADATVQDVFTQKDIDGTVYFDTLIINDDYWGSNSKLVVDADSIKSIFTGKFTHSSDFADTLIVDATFTPSIATKDERKKNLLDIHAKVNGAKAKILEYFLKDQISDTEGYAYAQAHVWGNIRGKETVMNITGDGEMIGVKTSVNFLKTRYALEPGKIRMDNTGFHVAEKLVLKDGKRIKGGIGMIEVSHPDQKAYIDGALTHQNLKDFGLNVIARFDNNLVMNTTLEDNSTFYGKVYATGVAHFIGPFEKLKLKVDAISEANSELVLPLGAPVEVTKNDYITFVNKAEAASDSNEVSIKDRVLGGLDLEINAKATPDINMKMVFDEKAGDVMQGKGYGDLTIKYSPTGELKMFGDYQIEEGNYLFTYKNLLNKPFKVVKGGTISWGDDDGNPYKARLDIQAAYDKKLSLSNLINSYIEGRSDLKKLASRPADISLLMNLKGELFSPDITFDIDVDQTNLDPSLRGSVGTALSTIRDDKDQLNRQVFGIIALQQFLPLENAQNVNITDAAISTGISTISELISQQLSLYINDLLASAIKDGGVVSDFELDLNFNYQGDNNSADIDQTAQSNVRVGGDVKFLDDKLRVYLGANMDIASNNNVGNLDGSDAQNNIGGDFIIEYSLTDNGQLKIRGYNRTETTTILGRSTRTGVGISYQRDFNTWKELIESFKQTKEERLTKKKKNLALDIKALQIKRGKARNTAQAQRIDKQIAQKEQKHALTSQKLTEHIAYLKAKKKRKEDKQNNN